ncbi:hypothetical protein K0I73_00880 [Shewanella mesophila]|uniref:ABC transporter substrate-binding protein n=1 Tax=Shewanella mesophila TaxID=2864208 RepID=UPI001C6567D9|nr:hypothetical protein [Shewanella mesophila]QYJ86357.1 hypothetical protein K0I73_00880 [Shewanella mesophila]
MDTKRLPAEQHAARSEAAWKVLTESKPDLIILADDYAVSSLSERLGNDTTPVVFLGLNANPRNLSLHYYENFTGVLERPLFRRALLFADKLLTKKDERKKLLMMFDNSRTSAVAISQIRNHSTSISIGKLDIDFDMIDTENNWQRTILESKSLGYDAIFIGLYHTLTKEDGSHAEPNIIIQWTATHSPLPHFGFWDFSIGPEANIGGYVLDGYIHGRMAGELVVQILAGSDIRQLHYVSDQTGRLLFSRSGLLRWNITLPDIMAEHSYWTP